MKATVVSVLILTISSLYAFLVSSVTLAQQSTPTPSPTTTPRPPAPWPCIGDLRVQDVPITLPAPANFTASVATEPLNWYQGDTETGPIVTLSWQSVSDAQYYRILVKRPQETNFDLTPIAIPQGGTTQLKLPPFPEAGEHCFRIHALNENGASPFVEACANVPVGQPFLPVTGMTSPPDDGKNGGLFFWLPVGAGIVLLLSGSYIAHLSLRQRKKPTG